jgi:malonate-semialdehyde dehydrogenase (acetylating) / methylmalonate-semialdehyde dehydrogenase
VPTNSKHLLQATQDVVSRVPQTTSAEFEAAVAAARDAFPGWRRTPVSVRQRVMLRLQHLIREHTVRTAHRPS